MSSSSNWYWNQKGKAQGPFTFEQLQSAVAEGHLRAHELMFLEGSTEWKRASEWPQLSPLFEEDRSTFTRFIKLPEEERTVIRPAGQVAEEKWVVLIRTEEDKEVRFKQKGPFGTDDIKRYLKEGKLQQTDHIWKKGFPKWQIISSLPEFHADNLGTTEEVKELLAPVQVMKRPEEEPVAPPVEQMQVKSAAQSAERAPEKKSVASPLIPVIPHVVPTGGSVAKPTLHISNEVELPAEAEIVSPSEEPLRQPLHRPAVKQAPAMALTEASVEAAAEEDEEVLIDDDDSIESLEATQVVPPKSSSRRWSASLAPLLSLSLAGFIVAGIWATLRTPGTPELPSLGDAGSSATGSIGSQGGDSEESPTRSAPPASARREAPAVKLGGEGIDKRTNEAKEKVAAAPKPTEEEIFAAEMSRLEDEEVVQAPAEKSPVPSSPAAAPKYGAGNQPEPASDGPRIEDMKFTSAPKASSLKINQKRGQLEVIGNFKKGDSIELRIVGRTGQILDLPALFQKVEFRAARNYAHGVSLNELRLPKGNYNFSAKWGSQKVAKSLLWGADKDQIEAALQAHRKQISFDQQQEKKKILKAIKDLSGLVSKAQADAKKGGLKSIQRELNEKVPPEVKISKLVRHELIFQSSWEQLGTQWDRLQSMAKDSRGPASSGELQKVKKALSSIESSVKNSAVMDGVK